MALPVPPLTLYPIGLKNRSNAGFLGPELTPFASSDISALPGRSCGSPARAMISAMESRYFTEIAFTAAKTSGLALGTDAPVGRRTPGSGPGPNVSGNGACIVLLALPQAASTVASGPVGSG